jgi:tetratricopeptide (TPR) repeat protein
MFKQPLATYSPLFLWLLIFASGNAQTPKVDSLKIALKNCKVDSQNIKIRNELCKYYAYNKPDTALILAREAFMFAHTDEYSGIIAGSCLYAGVAYNSKGNRDSAEFYFLRTIQIAHRHKNFNIEAAAYMGLGTCYNFWKKQDKALQNYLISYSLFKNIGDSGRIAAIALGIGNVYSDLNNINRALEFFNICLHYSEARKDSTYLARCYNNIGNLFLKNKNYDKALSYYTKSLDIKKSLQDIHGIANTYLNFGNIYTGINKIELAKTFYYKAKDSYAQLGDSAEYMSAISYIAECLLKENKTTEALANLKCAEGICRRNHYAADLAGLYGSMTRIYIMLGDTARARIALLNYTSVKDSIITEDMNRQIAQMTAQFENDKQKKELEIKETELTLSKKFNGVYTLATILFSVLLIILLFVIYKLKKANQSLKENNKSMAPDQKKH